MGASNLYATVTDTKNLLLDNWSLSTTPDITFMWEERSTGFMDDRRDFILLTPTNEDPQYFGLYGQDFLHYISVKIEVHSYQNLEHHEDLVNEIFRIIKANIRRTNYVDLMATSSYHDNDMFRNMYRHTIIIRYRKLNP
tara:strand:+ start:2007 stop:2423 length:417 start_codon:yes stop_codon:yes gene_type:complete